MKNNILIFLIIKLVFTGCSYKNENPKLDANTSVDLATSLLETNAYNQALPVIQKGLKKYPKSSELHRLYGVFLRDNGLLSQANLSFRQSLKLNKSNYLTFSDLAIMYSMDENIDEAKKYIDLAIAKGTHPKIFHNAGFIYQMLNENLKAKEYFEQAILLDPTSQRTYNNLGFVLGELKENEEAFNMFLKGGTRGEAYNNMGVLLQNEGDLKSAKKWFENALKVEPHLKTPKSNLLSINCQIEPESCEKENSIQ